MLHIPRLLIAGTQSGAGKTTLAAALMAALTRRGLRVQPYKVGPDYIDPGYHTAATGRVSRNLDAWFLGADGIREVFCRSSAGADVCLVEGVMGLYDGRGATSEGSSAALAKILQTPVVLVLDARSMARSAAAVVLGFRTLDPAVPLAGVILNRVGSQRHYSILKEVIEGEAGLPVLGWVGRHAEISLPERHLGLLPTAEKGGLKAHLERMAAVLEEGVDLGRLLQAARQAPPLPEMKPFIFPAGSRPPRVRLGLAKDEAFNFYYQDGLDLLTALGAELVPVSPLSGRLPADLDGLYIGGGFPEMFLPQLAANEGFKRDLARAFARGLPIYAECGGLMYLTRAICDFDGRAYAMAGLLPGICRMQPRRAALGYVQATALTESILAPAGTQLKGHEFHYSTLEEMPLPRAYVLFKAGEKDGHPDGYVHKNLLAAYLHLHFAACPAAAANLVARCAGFREKRETVS